MNMHRQTPIQLGKQGTRCTEYVKAYNRGDTCPKYCITQAWPTQDAA